MENAVKVLVEKTAGKALEEVPRMKNSAPILVAGIGAALFFIGISNIK